MVSVFYILLCKLSKVGVLEDVGVVVANKGLRTMVEGGERVLKRKVCGWLHLFIWICL